MITKEVPAHLFTATAKLIPPPGFSLDLTAFSHGWYDLPPFEADRAQRKFGRTLLLRDGTTAWTSLRESGSAILVRAAAGVSLTPAHRREIGTQWRAILRLDEDFGPFHAATRRSPRTRWIGRTGAGRLLRSPTVFEDVVKMICTTNCTWGSTRVMVTALVREFGTPLGTPIDIPPAGSRVARAADPPSPQRIAFPTAERIATAAEGVLRSRCSTGYRAPYLLEFARAVAGGRLDPEAWRTSTEETPALFASILSVKGVGPYAAGNILKLLGRYDYLGLDSWVRARYAALHHGGRKVSDRTIERAYAEFGRWRGLIFWLEMTRHWHQEKFGGMA
jgi:N-glycosylase/DNA lyase